MWFLFVKHKHIYCTMGIKLLNTFIKEKCKGKKSIKKISLCELSRKTIAIDTSIYMYRYKADKKLMNGMYDMCSLLLEYNIIPLFVFDGKPGEEKKEELKKRSNQKKSAEKEYNDLKKEIRLDPENDTIKETMTMLEKKFVRIKQEEVIEVKELIKGFGIQCIDAPNEADEICAFLALKKKVYAVMSEDMDMFAYGCPNIIRYFSILNKHCVLYKMSHILEDLNMNMLDFKKLCVISGTDYNNKSKNKNIFKYYDKYKAYIKSDYTDLFEYYVDIMRFENIYELNDVLSLYQVNNNNTMIDNIKMKIEPINLETIKKIMCHYNFIFT